MTARRGVILVAIVALLGGLAAIAAMAALAAQISMRGSLADQEQARLRLALETAAARAAVSLTFDDAARWAPDGRVYEVHVDDVTVTVRLIAETGRFDLNQGDPEVLEALLTRLGVDFRQASRVAQGLQAWRTPSLDTVARFDPAYAAAGLPQPGRRPLLAPEEFRRVIGVDGALYEAARPYLTVFGGPEPEPGFAPPELLLALGLPDFRSRQILADRRRDGALGTDAPAAGPHIAVFAEARAPSGAAMSQEIGLVLIGANGEFQIIWRRPLKAGDAGRVLEADADS